MKHTPGHWRIKRLPDEVEVEIVADEDSPRSWMERTVATVRVGNEEANAALIAAAPDLFLAVERLLREDDGGHGDLTMGLIEDAQAAIKKAKGEHE